MTVAPKKRKNMKHLHEMNDYEFCRWIQARGASDETINKVERINWKLDGFFLRFGKDAEGQPWFQTARSNVLYSPGEVIWYAMRNGYDHDKFTRAEKYYHLIKDIWESRMFSKMGNNVGMEVEVFDRSMATDNGDGTITFVNIPYSADFFYRPVTLFLYRVIESSSGETIADNYAMRNSFDEDLGLYGSASFIELDYSYFKEAVDSLTEDGIKSLKSLRHADRALKMLVREKVAEIKKQLRAYVLKQSENKNMLGDKFEGVVLKVNNTEYKIVTDDFKELISGQG